VTRACVYEIDIVADLSHSMISYPNYKFIFPIKALGMYAKRFGDAATNGSA